MAPSPVGKENSPPVSQLNQTGEKDSKALKTDASLAIIQKQDHIQNFQKWWSEGHGNVVAASHALLHVVEEDVLSDVISAGAAYHNCLGIEKLDMLLNKLDQSAGDPSLDPLRKAMQTKGGARNQARAVGTLLFSTARAIYDELKDGSADDKGTKAKCCQKEFQAEDSEQIKPDSEETKSCEPAPSFLDQPGGVGVSRVQSDSVPLGGSKEAGVLDAEHRAADPLGRTNSLDSDSSASKVVAVTAEKEAEAEPTGASTEEAILEQQDQVQRFQSWWAEGKGKEVASSHPMLSVLDAAVLSDIIAAGANYHTCLSADRLDALQRQIGKSTSSSLEALQRALQAKGGAKSQARAVGSVIFKEALDMFKNPPEISKSSAVASSGTSQLELSADRGDQPKSIGCVVADEIFEPPKRFICSESFPPEATVAVRMEPNKASSLVTSLPYGSEVLATAARGTYLQFRLEKGQEHDSFQHVWVPRVLDGLILFVEKPDPLKAEKEAEAEPPGASTEEAILEQQDQVQRFQSWWAEGKGKEVASSHPMLSVLDAAVLSDIIAAGANYHTCLSADRLDALQRQIGKSTSSSLEALQRALQAKGGAKSQARAVGSVIFKEALDMFKNPPEISKSSAVASSGTSQLELSADRGDQPKSIGCVVADEIFEPPKRFICSESFPPEATVAVRLAPSHQSDYLTQLPHGREIQATGRFGEFLQFRLSKEGATEAYVPWVFRGLTLFVPGPNLPRETNVPQIGCEANRLAQLEHRVSNQETIIKALQAELSAMRAHMSAVATAFGTLASKSS